MHIGKVVTVITLFIMLVSSVVCTASELGRGVPRDMTANSDQYANITADENWQMRADIWGNRIVWEDYRNDPLGGYGSPYYRNSDIYMHDLSTGDIIQLTDDPSAQIKPRIWENYVVWEDYRHGNADIYYIDLNTMTEHRVTTHGSDQISPKIHGEKIVWGDYTDNMFGDIYMYDIQEDETIVISDGRHRKENPDIYEDTIVWTDYRNYWTGVYETMVSDIYMYDLNTEEESPFIEEPIHQRNPSIYKNTATWIEYEGKNNNIYMKRLGENKTVVSAEPSSEEAPEIYGGRIIFFERYYEGVDHVHDAIWIYDILENTKTRVAKVDVGETEGVVARFPAIYQDQIVWEERHPSASENLTFQYDIFYTYLGKEAPQILQTSIYSDTDEGNGAADMILRDGANFTVNAEVVDPDGDLVEVILEYADEEIEMEEISSDIYSATILYDRNMSASSWELSIRATDEEGFTADSDGLTITLIERPPEITHAGVGTSTLNISTETNFTLEDGNRLYFTANVTDPDDDLDTVYLHIDGFNLTDERFEMNETESGIYVFELEYSEVMIEGEIRAWVSAEDVRGNSANSQELTIYAEFPQTDDDDNGDNGDNGLTGDGEGIWSWLFFLLLILLIIVVLSIIYIYKKRTSSQEEDGSDEEMADDDLEEDRSEEETPAMYGVDKGLCPNCVEVIPADSTECPHCGEELEPPE